MSLLGKRELSLQNIQIQEEYVVHLGVSQHPSGKDEVKSVSE